jgi:hypothetical protein
VDNGVERRLRISRATREYSPNGGGRDDTLRNVSHCVSPIQYTEKRIELPKPP